MSTPNPIAVTVAPSVMGWSCSKCRFAGHMSDDSLQCRFNAPPTGTAPNTSTWETVAATDWCGDYEPSPT